MAKTTKGVTAGAIKKATTNDNPAIITKEWNGIDIKIRKRLSLDGMLVFVNGVSRSCFDENKQYIPEVMDFSIRSAVFDLYSNIKTPKDTDEKYEFVYGNDELFRLIIDNIDEQQFSNIVSSIKKKVDSMVQENISGAIQQVNELYVMMSAIKTQMSEMFAGIDPETLKNIASAIDENGIDETKLMSAYIASKDKDGD